MNKMNKMYSIILLVISILLVTLYVIQKEKIKTQEEIVNSSEEVINNLEAYVKVLFDYYVNDDNYHDFETYLKENHNDIYEYFREYKDE